MVLFIALKLNAANTGLIIQKLADELDQHVQIFNISQASYELIFVAFQRSLTLPVRYALEIAQP